MGTGKSTVGRMLATVLGFDFIDTDQVIERRHGSIASIFRDGGEDHFRSIEREVANDLATSARTVIATGGRLMLDAENAVALGRTGRVFCLVAAPGEILLRVTSDGQRAGRPLLDAPDAGRAIMDLLAERRSGYGRFEQIITDGRSPKSIADEIAARRVRAPGAPRRTSDSR